MNGARRAPWISGRKFQYNDNALASLQMRVYKVIYPQRVGSRSWLRDSAFKPQFGFLAFLRSSFKFAHAARVVKWQTRTFEGRMPKGMRVQVPPRAPNRGCAVERSTLNVSHQHDGSAPAAPKKLCDVEIWLSAELFLLLKPLTHRV